MRFKNLFQSLLLLICAQATAMQMKILITFNEMKFNEISPEKNFLSQFDVDSFCKENPSNAEYINFNFHKLHYHNIWKWLS